MKTHPEEQIPEALRLVCGGEAGRRLLQLCAFSCMDAMGWEPLPEELFRPETPGFSTALTRTCEKFTRMLPGLFAPGETLPQALFVPKGPAARLCLLYRQRPPQERLGLAGALWQALTEAPRRQSFAASLQDHHRGRAVAWTTQLFTPRWLSRFLLENACGRLAGGCENSPFYLKSSQENQTEHFVPAEELTLLDPCAGAGELLCAAYDCLYPRLLARGMGREAAARLLLEQHLSGMDLDRGALDACYLELMLRGRAFDPDFYTYYIKPDLAAAENADGSFCREGSLLAPGMAGFDRLAAPARRMLTKTYHITAANPPYMGLRRMEPALRDFLRQHYPDGKNDLYAAFALRCLSLTKEGGCAALLMPSGWLTLASFAPLREKMFRSDIPVLIRLGAHAFPALPGEVVQTAAFTALKRTPGAGCLVCDLEAEPTPQAKEKAFLAGKGRRFVPRISGEKSGSCRRVGDIARVCQGLATGDNARFVRLWFEVAPDSICRGCPGPEEAARSEKRWFPYNKGGGFRRWWGNDLFVVDFARDGQAIRAQRTPSGRPRARVQNHDCYFRPGVSWSFVGCRSFSARLTPAGAIFDVGGSTAFPADGDDLYLAALLNSAPARRALLRRNPTVNFQVGDIAALPAPDPGKFREEIHALAAQCVDLSRRRWEETEPAPAFTCHPWAGRDREDTFAATLARWEGRFREEERQLCAAQRRLDEIFGELLEDDTPIREEPAQAPDAAECCRRFLSWCAGSAAGRFGSGPVRDCIPLGQGEKNSLAALTEQLCIRLWGREELPALYGFAAQQLGWKVPGFAGLERYFSGEFFRHHQRMYRNRPIYWLCPGTRPVLLYYHALSGRTAERLAALRGIPMNPALRQARALWQAIDRDEGVLPHLTAAAQLGLARLPRSLAAKAASNQALHHVPPVLK